MNLVKRPTAIVRKPVSSNKLVVKHSTGVASIYKTAWVVLGPPGVGKSTLFSGFDDPLFLVTSEKEVGRLQVPFINIESWEQLMEVTDELLNNRSKYPYKFLVIDFIDAVFTLCDLAVCEKLGVTHRSDSQWGKGGDTIKSYFQGWLTELIASDYGIMMVSHVNDKDVFTQSGNTTKKVCTLPERARNIIFPLVNVVGTMDYKTVWEKSKVDPTKKVTTRRRVIAFEGNEYIEAKDRDGVLPSELVLFNDPKKNFQMFKEYYEGIRKK